MKYIFIIIILALMGASFPVIFLILLLVYLLFGDHDNKPRGGYSW